MKKLLLSIAFTLFITILFAHPWKPVHHVIIDTDCGIDDYRTICMLLATTDVRVLGIVTSDGVLDAETGYYKLKSLLTDLHHEGILTGLSSQSQKLVNDCPAAKSLSWGTKQDSMGSILSAKDVVEYILRNSNEQIDYLCLGSLNTAAYLLKESDIFYNRIREIIWSSDVDMNENNFNYGISEEGYAYITEKTKTTLRIITGDKNHYKYSAFITNEIDEIGNAYADKIVTSIKSLNSPYTKTFFDERVALYLKNADFYRTDSLSSAIYLEILSSTLSDIENEILEIITGYTGNQNQVLKKFPLDSGHYQSDVCEIMYSTIEKYGTEEWIAGVIANELHRHLGVYAIIGTKMGIRAREYFGAGIDELKIVSFAGVTPPFSCMNDGLQVSTGATLGHGLISISSDTLKLPEAEFMYLGKKITIALKENYRKKIEKEINGYRIVYGLSNDMYWELVRKAALSYWSNWNRHDIFIIKTDI